jgi:hypothetical protein
MGALPTPLTPALASRESRVSGGERRCSSSRTMVRRERPGGIRQGRRTALLPRLNLTRKEIHEIALMERQKELVVLMRYSKRPPAPVLG